MSRGRACRWIVAAIWSCLAWSAPDRSLAQTASPPTASTPKVTPTNVTVFAAPHGAHLSMVGRASEVAGAAPLDVPDRLRGRYSVTIRALGYSVSQGVIFIPPGDRDPYLLSEPPHPTSGLLLRSLNLPGVPAISAGHTGRGVVLMTAAVGGGVGAIRANIFFMNDVNEPDEGSQFDARDWKFQRNIWAGYVGGVWALSALDYIIRPRVSVVESGPSRITVGAPAISRGGVLWRSVLVPGAGQEFANERVHSAFWLTAVLTGGAAYVIMSDRHHQAETDVTKAELSLERAGSADVAARQADLNHFLNVESNWSYARKVTGYVLLGIHAGNLIDALILPIHRPEEASPPKLSLVAPLSPGNARLAVRYRF